MQRSVARGLAICSIVAITTWVVVAIVRAGHPFALEWREGGMLAHVARVNGDQALYAKPSLEFIAFPYPPLYVWVCSILGESLACLRWVSILSTVALLVLLFVHVRAATGSALAGLAGAGIFAGSYRWAGAWFDVGRVDMLALALALASLTLARFREGTRNAAVAGGLCALAFLTKQNAVLIAAPAILPLASRGRREALAFGLGALALGGGAVLWLHFSSEGWSTWYLFRILAGHGWFAPKVMGFWTEDLVWWLPAAFACGLAARGSNKFLFAPAIGMLASAWLGRAHVGGYDNTLLPASLLGALLVGEAVGRAPRPSLVPVLALAQILVLAYDPRDQLPTAADRLAGERLVERLREFQGPVLAPHGTELATRAGHPPSAHAQAIRDVLASEGSAEIAEEFVREQEEAFAEGRYDAVLLHRERDGGSAWTQIGAFTQGYRMAEDVLAGEDPGTLRPVTGADVRARLLYVVRR